MPLAAFIVPVRVSYQTQVHLRVSVFTLQTCCTTQPSALFHSVQPSSVIVSADAPG